MDPIELSFEVACSPAHAFAIWAEHTSMWWPTDHSVSGASDLTVTFEPRPGGRIYERTGTGDEYDWGEVLAWEPPARLVYLWHIGADRSDATEVEVTFVAQNAGTEVTIAHRGWERLGAVAADRRERNRTGWADVLDPFRSACAGSAEAATGAGS